MKNISHFLKKYQGTLTLIVLLMFFQTFGTLYIPTLMSDIVNNGIVTKDMNAIYKTGIIMLIVAFITSIVAITGSWLACSLSADWAKDIRTGLFQKTQSLSIYQFDKFGTASMITRSTNDVNLLQDTLSLLLQLVLPAPVMTIGGLILAFSKDWVMAVIIVITIISFLIVTVFICKKVMPFYYVQRKEMDEINRRLREYITGVRVIRAFNKVEREKKRINVSFSKYAQTTIRVNKFFAVIIPIVTVTMNLCIVCIIWFGGKRASEGFIKIGDIMAMTEYALLTFWYLVMGVSILISMPRFQTCIDRINEVLSIDETITDGTEKLEKQQEDVVLEFKDVTFGYEEAEEPVLSNLSFQCRRGETTAIIGGTGSGKSTIAKLIPRFYDIESGAILLNGQNIDCITKKELRRQIGYVPQKAFLFSGTIEDNLKYGDERATREELQRAAKIAQAEEFIESHAEGYHRKCAQGGANFSGGQKQRLSIARALVRKAALYIFDDSFSALDFNTDAKLRHALKEEIIDAAVIIVAQRVSTILHADQIIVLDNGRIAGIGTHETL